MTEIPASTPAAESSPPDEQPPHHYRLTQFVVLGVAAGSIALFWWAGNRLDVPAYRGYQSSLLLQPGAGGKMVAVLLAAVLFVVCLVLAGLVAGRHWLYAGLFAGAAGLAALSVRGGPSRFTWFHADAYQLGRGVFLTLLAEVLLLFTLVGAAWYLLTQRAMPQLYPENPRERPATPSLGNRLQGLGTQAGIMAFLVMLLTPNDNKAQVLAAVFFAGLIATFTAEHFFPGERLAAWWWVGPLAVAVVAYAGNYFTASPDGLRTGYLTGAFAPLARPLPLDYASAGTIGALLGFWSAGDRERFHTPAPADVSGKLPAGRTTTATPATESPNGQPQ